MDTFSLPQLLKIVQVGQPEVEARVIVQLASSQVKQTRGNKPYLQTEWTDGVTMMALKFWGDTAAYEALRDEKSGTTFKLSGGFVRDDYGVSLYRPELAKPDELERKLFLAGGNERAVFLKDQSRRLQERIDSIKRPQLRLVCQTLLKQVGDKLVRTAAARKNHHARVGGLIEHVVSMLGAADGMAAHYGEADPDIVAAGILFHDIGKVRENVYPEDSFVQCPDLSSVLIGHISMGAQMFYNLWEKTRIQHPVEFPDPISTHLRDHVLHVIIAHHGTQEHGSPVVPATPEAWIVHIADLLDAHIEMLRMSYAEAVPTCSGAVEAHWPLRGSLAIPFKVLEAQMTRPALPAS